VVRRDARAFSAYVLTAAWAVATSVIQTMQRFGEKFRTLRRRHGLTMRDLADRLGLATHGYVGDLESGRRQPSLELALKIADIFGVSVDHLARDDLDIDGNGEQRP
jgi:transcriptional regulator with XRE-family HTH domain